MGVRSLPSALMAALLAACGPVAGSPAASASPQPAVTLIRPTPTPTETSGCLATTPVTAEHPKNSNTAAFSRGWYVSPDRQLWASATGPFVVGSNKVLWERPSDYQASSVTFPVAGCWEVEARAQASVLDFVVFVVPR
jgi:hypothetical protein